MSATTLLSPGATSIDLIVSRVGALYSLPAVAVEVLQFTARPNFDVRQLKACIERDPALTAKILRVVNSSLFGLSRPVGDLNEAVALLGAKQLKLLVLGFSLPEDLFLGVAAPQLAWYWSTTLARAVAAREISEQLFHQPGDDAFLAGLLQDLGVLVLLRELGAPYVALISGAIAYGADLKPLERQALGFDHIQLTTGLLAHWRMPPLLVHAIGERREYKRLAKNRDEHARIARVLHLAELVAQLVGQHRLSVLPDLLDAGREYCDLDKQRLHDLVASLEPKVRQLAAVLSVDAAQAGEYSRVLAEAHQRLAQLAESVVCDASSGATEPDGAASGDDASEQRAEESAAALRAAIEKFMNLPAPRASQPAVAERPPEPVEVVSPSEAPSSTPSEPAPEFRLALGDRDEFAVQLMLAVGQCRSLFQPLSLALVGVSGTATLDADQQRLIERMLDAACRTSDAMHTPPAARGTGRRVLLLPCLDRLEAVRIARGVLERLRQLIEPAARSGQLPARQVAAGVASVTAPAKNFQAQRLLETADRCLAAAQTPGGVKSLEVI